jgi:polyhydroxyalkanoate synthesis regulator phasin
MKTITIEILTEKAEQAIQKLINEGEVVLAENPAVYGNVMKHTAEDMNTKAESEHLQKPKMTINELLNRFQGTLSDKEATKMIDILRKEREWAS